jgi:hypothetical protein
MTLLDLLELHHVLRVADTQVVEGLGYILRPDVPVERLALWVDRHLENPLAVVIALEAQLDGLGGFFEDEGRDVVELRASLAEAREKIEAALKVARVKVRKKRKVAAVEGQGGFFEVDEDDPTGGSGDPG